MNSALILAGGRGQRMHMDLPKQLAKIHGRPMIEYSIKTFSEHSEIDKIYIVSHEKWQKEIDKILEKLGVTKFAGYILPGDTRRESSENAVKLISEENAPDDIVLIHDAARPGITAEIITDNIKEAGKNGACCTAIRCRDTLCRAKDNVLTERVDREEIVILQTPQTFRLDLIRRAHERYTEELAAGNNLPEITDDTGLVQYFGGTVTLVRGSFSNMKITEPGDIEFFEGKTGKY